MDQPDRSALFEVIRNPPKFFLFGMGNRRKLIYRNGSLVDARSGEPLYQWSVREERIVAERYCVHLTTTRGEEVVIREDQTAIHIEESGNQIRVCESPVVLPDFHGHRHERLLRILHHEILINILDGMPVPNYFVYRKPWQRDAAMMCMVLEKTGNIRLVRDWILSLSDPFDHNNKGENEPDNLGQTLYLLSLVADRSHPLVSTVLEWVDRFRTGDHIRGMTDYAQHPVYQTTWLKYGLHGLGLPDPFQIPLIYDSYSSLFWMDFREDHLAGDLFADEHNTWWPYLGWAQAHFHGMPPPMEYAGTSYPVSWEARASEADYSGMRTVAPVFADLKLSMPHTWHAAEMFLYLIEL